MILKSISSSESMHFMSDKVVLVALVVSLPQLKISILRVSDGVLQGYADKCVSITFCHNVLWILIQKCIVSIENALLAVEYCTCANFLFLGDYYLHSNESNDSD